MSRVWTLPKLEAWLVDHADSWFLLPDQEYTALVDQWSALFHPLIEAGNVAHKGHQAMMVLETSLPCDTVLFNGVQIPRLENMGGGGRAAYRAVGLRALDRDLANQLELVAVAVDFSWCCVFSHEAGAYVWEQLYEPARHGRYSR
jgi:hypothetical protein